MIDNLEQILPLLKFDSDDDFYYLQILQRKKENPQLGSNSRVIKNYYIKNTKSLLDRYDEIKMLCDVFHARAMFRLNRRSWERVGFKAMVNIANTMGNREYQFLPKSYDRACGNGHNDPNKTWILDVDVDPDSDIYVKPDWILDFINEECLPIGEKGVTVIDSANGWHLITKPFDPRKFKERFPTIDIHKDNPTNLYIPDFDN